MSEQLPDKSVAQTLIRKSFRVALLALLIISTVGWFYFIGKTGLALVRWVLP
jgi:hypothetical protein